MPANAALHALHLQIILPTVIDHVGYSHWHEGIELDDVGCCVDLDNAHHQTPAAAVIEYFVLVLD